MNNFFCFNFKNRKGLIYLISTKDYDAELLFKSQFRFSEVPEFVIAKGKIYHSYAHFPDPCNLAISKKFLQTLIENDLSGWDYYPIKIKNFENPYYGLQIMGKCGKIKRPITPGFVKGYLFEEATWDGSDIFTPEDTNRIIMTSKTKDLLIKNKIFEEQEFVNVTELEWYSV